MSDLEKLFEHAPEGATELGKIDRSGFLAWFNSDGDIWIGYWKERSFPHEVVATRPQPRKTVEDAVEYFKEWPGRLDSVCIWDDSLGDYLFWVEYYTPVSDCYEVCNYEQFEACVDAKAKSEPEWTHTYFNIRCRIADLHPDEFGTVVIIKEEGDYSLAHPSKLKPIKPTISRDAKEQLEFYAQYRADKYGDHAMKSDLSDYIAEHEVLE